MTATMVGPVWQRPHLRGLSWVTWRQHRIGFAGAVAVLGAFGILMLVNGLAMHADYSRLGLDSCGSLNSSSCRTPMEIFSGRYSGIAQFLPRVLLFLPAVLGVFLGAPLVARELETGTYRFAWTQGRSRVEWVTAKLVLLGAALTVLAFCFTLLFTWWFRPWEPLMSRMASGQAYEIEGVVFAARTLFGFTLGALLGAMIRRTVPAMAATAVLWVGVVLPSVLYLRPHIERPVTALANSVSDIAPSWTISSWVQDSAGHRLSNVQIDTLLMDNRGSLPPGVDFHAWLAQHGYTEWVTYQPGSRFWHFQTIEASCYVVLALLLAGATIAWVRRRAA
ncbi:MAG: hypothetical protein JWO57_1957 [Pseudonocardiales bacterium]|nr:hypothetical protein [Pseudonocardiales bacterium]